MSDFQKITIGSTQYGLKDASAREDLADVKSAINALQKAKHYGVRWDKVNAKMERTGLVTGYTTTTTNFGHFGSVNANYYNPFDKIYPWSGRKLCNISLETYMALGEGDSITDCVVAWEGDVDFAYDHADGVWVYTPEFWGISYDDGGFHYFDVCDMAVNGYVHYPEMISARNLGVKEARTINGTSKNVLLPKLGMPCKREAMSTIHTYAKNGGMALDTIYSIDASNLLLLVEYATFDSQTAIGQGVSNLYYENAAGLIQRAATSSTVVQVLASQASAHIIPGAIFDIGTSQGGNQVGSYLVVSSAVNGSDATLLDVTLNAAVTVTTSNYYSIHGRGVVADADIGSKSGYIGTNGKCDAYYRGEVLFGNMWHYVLGAYKSSNEHVYLASDSKQANQYDAIDTTVHTDTGVTLALTGGYIKSLGWDSNAKLSAYAFCTEVGGGASNPVGDYFYITTGSSRVLIVGGNANNGANDGLFNWNWNNTSGNSNWNYAGRPPLLTLRLRKVSAPTSLSPC